MPDIAALAAALRARGDPAKKEWWERYLKREIEFYGVPMAQIRVATHEWSDGAPPAELRAAAYALLQRPIAEEKLAGILVMQELLLPAGELDPQGDLPRLAACFDHGHIRDWNTTDWLCVRVLAPMIERGGRPVGAEVARWVEAPSLWRRRSAAVAFVPVAAQGDALFPGLVDMLLGVCSRLVRDEARFAQTGVGWALRELSGSAAGQVYEFVAAKRDLMSREAVRMAAARLSDEQRAALGITGQRRRR